MTDASLYKSIVFVVSTTTNGADKGGGCGWRTLYARAKFKHLDGYLLRTVAKGKNDS